MNGIILTALTILGAIGFAGVMIGVFAYGNNFLRINRYRSQKDVVVAKAEAEATQIQADMRLHGLREARQKLFADPTNGKALPEGPPLPVDWVEATERLKGDVVDGPFELPSPEHACERCGATFIFEPSVVTIHGRQMGLCNARVEEHTAYAHKDKGGVFRCAGRVRSIEVAKVVQSPL